MTPESPAVLVLSAINGQVSEKFCRQCHTPTMSPKFDFAVYQAKGLHAKKAAE